MRAAVSVLMATYNRAEYLEQALSGILYQDLRPHQVIVVNDGSNDGTGNILDKYKEQITSIHQENAGKSAALNRALPLVTGDFIWIFDDDDVPFPDALSRHVSTLSNRPEAGFTYSPMYWSETGPDGQLTPVEPGTVPDLTSAEVFPRLLESCFITQPGSLVRTECFLKTGKYREDLTRSVDYEFVLRLARQFRAVGIKENTFYYRYHFGARGTARERFDSSERWAKWLRSNQVVFRDLYDDLALWEYLPHEPDGPAPKNYNEDFALLTRMSVMGGKGLWDLCVADMEQLVATDAPGTLEMESVCENLRKMFKNQIVVRELVHKKPELRKLTALVDRMHLPEAKLVCARSIYHRSVSERNDGNVGAANLMVRAALRILGVRGMGRVAMRKLMNRPLLGRRA